MINKNEIATKLFHLKNKETLDFFNLSEEEKMTSIKLNTLAKNQKEHFIKETLHKLNVVPNLQQDKDIIEKQKKQELEEIVELRNKVINLLDSKD